MSDAIAVGVMTMGEHTYGQPRVTVYEGDTAKVKIGRYCSIARGVEFFVGGNHRVDWVTTYPLRFKLDLPGALEDGHPATKGNILLGNDVWIGADARILSGVTIGDGAVIGMNAVVTSNVRPYAIVAGNPAKELRRRFSDDVVEALLRISWWNWPDEEVRARVNQLCSTNVEEFIRKFDPLA